MYGSPKVWPTLAESKQGHTLKRGHSLTPVQDSNLDDVTPLKRRSKEQRVDIMFSPTQVRVTVFFSGKLPRRLLLSFQDFLGFFFLVLDKLWGSHKGDHGREDIL